MEYKLGDICKIRSGKRLPKGEVVDIYNTGNKYIRVRDLNNRYIDINSVQYITQEAAEKIKRYTVKKGDIIISVVGTIGLVSEIPKELDGAYLTENCDNLLINEDICLKKFLKLYLQSKIGQQEINSKIVGSTQPKLPIYGIEDIAVDIPSINVQKRIIKIIDKIEKKIQLNNQMNDNLLEIANELLKKDFKEADDIEVLSNVIRFVKGKKPDKISKFKQENYEKYLTIACLNSQELNYADKDKMLIADNDLLMVMDGASSGDVYYSDYGIVGSTLARVDITNKQYISEFIYFALKHYKNLVHSKNTGSAIPHTDKVFVGTLEVPKINIEQQERYKTLLTKIQKNDQENEILKKLRDTLLPKLMNGEIDLDKIEI